MSFSGNDFDFSNYSDNSTTNDIYTDTSYDNTTYTDTTYDSTTSNYNTHDIISHFNDHSSSLHHSYHDNNQDQVHHHHHHQDGSIEHHPGHHHHHHEDGPDHHDNEKNDTGPLIDVALLSDVFNSERPKSRPISINTNKKSYYTSGSSTLFNRPYQERTRELPKEKNKEIKDDSNCFSCLPCFK